MPAPWLSLAALGKMGQAKRKGSEAVDTQVTSPALDARDHALKGGCPDAGSASLSTVEVIALGVIVI